jgi:hypothetical protein
MAASELMIFMISELPAVWDHQPARGYAGMNSWRGTSMNAARHRSSSSLR